MYTYTHTPVRRQNLNHTYSWYGASAKGPGTAADVVLGISAGKIFHVSRGTVGDKRWEGRQAVCFGSQVNG